MGNESCACIYLILRVDRKEFGVTITGKFVILGDIMKSVLPLSTDVVRRRAGRS
jgi:hypothetical protein